MHHKTKFILVWLIGLWQIAYAQPIQIQVTTTYKGQEVRFGETYYRYNITDSILFDDLKIYLTNFRLLNGNKVVWTDQERYHLCEAADSTSFSFTLSTESHGYNKIEFDLGIDSVTNASGIKGGSLDPTKGMYWAWQSGYINCKIEGKSNLCATRQHEFQYHLGGYLPPFYALQHISTEVHTGIKKVFINLPLDEIFDSLDLRTKNQIMIPGNEAVNISRLIAQKIKVRYQ